MSAVRYANEVTLSCICSNDDNLTYGPSVRIEVYADFVCETNLFYRFRIFHFSHLFIRQINK